MSASAIGIELEIASLNEHRARAGPRFVTALVHFPKDVSECGFAQFAFEGSAGGVKNLLQLGLDALADRALRIGLRARHHERFVCFDGAKDASKRYVSWRVR